MQWQSRLSAGLSQLSYWGILASAKNIKQSALSQEKIENLYLLYIEFLYFWLINHSFPAAVLN